MLAVSGPPDGVAALGAGQLTWRSLQRPRSRVGGWELKLLVPAGRKSENYCLCTACTFKSRNATCTAVRIRRLKMKDFAVYQKIASQSKGRQLR